MTVVLYKKRKDTGNTCTQSKGHMRTQGEEGHLSASLDPWRTEIESSLFPFSNMSLEEGTQEMLCRAVFNECTRNA
jgi:hypothetical protein